MKYFEFKNDDGKTIFIRPINNGGLAISLARHPSISVNLEGNTFASVSSLDQSFDFILNKLQSQIFINALQDILEDK